MKDIQHAKKILRVLQTSRFRREVGPGRSPLQEETQIPALELVAGQAKADQLHEGSLHFGHFTVQVHTC